MLTETEQGADYSKQACFTEAEQGADSKVRKFLHNQGFLFCLLSCFFYIDKLTTGQLPILGTGLASEVL